MKVFVAGATGAIGRPLVTELVRQGHAVIRRTRFGRGGLGEVFMVITFRAGAVPFSGSRPCGNGGAHE